MILICIFLIAISSIFFMCPLAICTSSLYKCLFTSSAYVLMRLFVSCVVWVFVFWILIPYQIYSLQVLYISFVGGLFILLLCLLAVQKLFILIKFHLLLFAFVSLDWSDISLQIVLRPMSKRVLPMFSSRSSEVSCLTFNSFSCICTVFPTPSVEEVIFYPFYILDSFALD